MKKKKFLHLIIRIIIESNHLKSKIYNLAYTVIWVKNHMGVYWGNKTRGGDYITVVVNQKLRSKPAATCETILICSTSHSLYLYVIPLLLKLNASANLFKICCLFLHFLFVGMHCKLELTYHFLHSN